MTFNQTLAGIGIIALVIWLAWHDIRTKLEHLKNAVVALAEANKVAAEAWRDIAQSLVKLEEENND